MDFIEFGYHKATLKAMNDQRHDGTLCDMKIMVADGHVFAHKGVLATCSPYFHTMFTGGFKERQLPMTEINMSDVFPDLGTADSVIQSMYTGKLNITPDNVSTIYSACSYLLYDKPKPFCEDVMGRDLCLENCLEFWEATYQHNTSSLLHSQATDLLKNRFHDFFIYQECLLEAPVSTLFGLVKAGVTIFCSPKQILTFFVRWFLRSSLTETNILKQLVTAADLSTPSNLHVENIMDDVRLTGPMTTAEKQKIQLVLAELYGTFHSESSGKDMVLDTKGQKRHLNDDLDIVHVKHIKIDKEESSGKENEQFGKDKNRNVGPSGRKMHPDKGSREPFNYCNNETHSSESDPIPVCSSVMLRSFSSVDDQTQDRCQLQMSRCFSSNTDKIDVLLAVAPSCTGLDGKNHKYGQLNLYAYILSSHHWVDLGTRDYPLDQNYEKITVSSSQLHAAGDKIFISTGYDLYFVHLSSSDWKWVRGLPGESAQRRIFPLCVKDVLYLMVRHEAKGDTGSSDSEDTCSPSPSRRSLQPDNKRVIFGKITEYGLWEEIICFEDKMDQNIPSECISYGPCWRENSVFLIHKRTDVDDGSLQRNGVLCFDPQSKDVLFIPFPDGPEKLDDYQPQQETLSLELDNWIYLWQTPVITIAKPYECPAIRVKYQTSEDKQSGHVEKQCITFPDMTSCRIHYLPSLGTSGQYWKEEIPVNHIFAMTGSCLWHLNNTTATRNSLEELDIRTPDVVTKHPPPPCNVILSVTGASLDGAFFADKPLARYHQVHIPTDGPTLPWEETIDPVSSDHSSFDTSSNNDGEYSDDDFDDYHRDYNDACLLM